MNNLVAVINEVMPRFNTIAEQHKQVRWATESQFALQAFEKNTYLQKCSVNSIKNAVINVAAVGLTLNPADGYAYLVPEYNKSSGQQECQLRVSFKGLIKAANDSGAIKWVKADVVKANDSFTYRGVNELPVHEMNPFATDRGETIGVYCIAKTFEGDFLIDMIPRSEIDQIRKCAKTDMVWGQWFDEMAKKAVIKRAAKQWPKAEKSEQLHQAIEVINETEGSDPAYFKFTKEQKDEFDLLVATEDGLGLIAFEKAVGVDIFTNLYNSGEKGKIVKLKDSVKAIQKAGWAELKETVVQCTECIDNDDYLGFQEIVSEISDDSKRLLGKHLDLDTLNKIEIMKGENDETE